MVHPNLVVVWKNVCNVYFISDYKLCWPSLIIASGAFPTAIPA